MSKRLALFAVLVAGCMKPVIEGGSNANDRTGGGEQGEVLLTGAMLVSQDGKFVLAQRNQTSVFIDVETQAARELSEQVDRFIFAKSGDRAVAVVDGVTVVSYELPAMTEAWRATVPFTSATGPTMARLTDDGQYLVLGDQDRLFVMSPTGAVTGTVPIGSYPTELSFVPGTSHALAVGTTRWSNHLPSTSVVDIDLSTGKATSVDVPNCSAPIVVLPDATRAFLSPTFCQEGTTTASSQWTNPDPVSVIDLSETGPRFVKNLPGFGPVAMDEQGHRAVAYLDVQRMDESMFDDKSLIPSREGPRYHIMTIDPKTLAYRLAGVGEVLPRFVMSRSGSALLVDATVQQVRGEAKVKATIDSSGNLTLKLSLFGKVDSLFGSFDLDAQTYAPFGGPAASLDRFVQMADGDRVFTLKTRSDGMGGDLYRIDLAARSATSLSTSLRDIGLLADGNTLVLRERLSAAKVQTSTRVEWYRRERFCFSLDGITCETEIEWQDSTPFQSGPTCTSYHDC